MHVKAPPASHETAPTTCACTVCLYDTSTQLSVGRFTIYVEKGFVKDAPTAPLTHYPRTWDRSIWTSSKERLLPRKVVPFVRHLGSQMEIRHSLASRHDQSA